MPFCGQKSSFCWRYIYVASAGHDSGASYASVFYKFLVLAWGGLLIGSAAHVKKKFNALKMSQ